MLISNCALPVRYNFNELIAAQDSGGIYAFSRKNSARCKSRLITPRAIGCLEFSGCNGKRGVRYLNERDSARDARHITNNKHVTNHITIYMHRTRASHAVRARPGIRVESNSPPRASAVCYRKIRVRYSSHEMWVRSCSS